MLREASKAFVKVLHNGLQYKIILLNLPDTMTKFLNNFTVSIKAKLKISTYTGQPFSLSSRVLQGSALSLTLVYTIFTSVISQAAHGCLNIQYANITKIITYPGKSRQYITARTVQEIEKNQLHKTVENKTKNQNHPNRSTKEKQYNI